MSMFSDGVYDSVLKDIKELREQYGDSPDALEVLETLEQRIYQRY